MVGLVIYWFMTLGQSSDFPTGEVQYSTMPSLLHPYQQAWQSPYGVIWYAIQRILVAYFLPIVNLFVQQGSCPNHCMAIVNYVNGTRASIPFESPIIWPMSLAWITGLAVFNIPFLWLLRKSSLLTAYFMVSMWLFATTPVNLPVLWLIVLAYLPVKIRQIGVGWLFLVLAVLAKLPFGAPGSVWSYALHSGAELGHWFPYGLFGVWFVGLSVYWIDRYRHKGNVHWFMWLHPQWKAIAEYD